MFTRQKSQRNESDQIKGVIFTHLPTLHEARSSYIEEYDVTAKLFQTCRTLILM
jgi:hypothetical protein